MSKVMQHFMALELSSKEVCERQSDEEAEVTSNVHQQLHVVKHWIEKGFIRSRNVHGVRMFILNSKKNDPGIQKYSIKAT